MKNFFTLPILSDISVLIRVLLLFSLLLILSTCTKPPPHSLLNSRNVSSSPDLQFPEKFVPENTVIWSNQFRNSDWTKEWDIQPDGDWGWENLTVISDPTHHFSQVLRVRYPADSGSYGLAKKQGNPVGGGQFYAKLGISPQNSLRLSYFLRFSDNFNFVKGGKLPGLFGGRGNNGGNIPDGSDGFSARYMWRRNGEGEVYAYLPSSVEHGTSLGRGTWRFQPGRWYHLEQEVTLNQPGKADGLIRVWVDGELVLAELGLVFRRTEALQIEGILFSTFFGGSDESWVTPQDVYVDFANFVVSE